MKELVKPLNISDDLIDRYLGSFTVLLNNIINLKETFTGKGDIVQTTIEDIIKEIFEKQNQINIENIYKDFTKIQDSIDKDCEDIKNEVEGLLDGIEDKENPMEFINDVEVKLKDVLQSQFANILEIIIQLRFENKEQLKPSDISDSQWEQVIENIKNFLAKSVHEKSQEADKILSEEFEKEKLVFKEKIAGSFRDQFEQRTIYLGILNLFNNELKKLHKAILLKKNNLERDLNRLQETIYNKFFDSFKNINEDLLEQVKSIGENLKIALQGDISEDKKVIDNFWSVNNREKVKGEILKILTDFKEIFILVPEIQNYVPVDNLINLTGTPNVKLASRDSHKSEIVKKIKERENTDFKKLKDNKIIIISGNNSHLVVCIEQNSPDKNIIGFGTNYRPLINFLAPFLSSKWRHSKSNKKIRIQEAFNQIIININEFKGSKISKILQNIYNISTKKGGLSLSILDMKVLITKLKNITTPLQDSLKAQVVDKIQGFNQELSGLELDIVPEFTAPKISTPQTTEVPETVDTTSYSTGQIDYNKTIKLFELFFEKIDSLKGSDLSNEIQNVINLVINLQGYPSIIKWKNDLGNKDTLLDESLKTKIKEDFNRWKSNILTASPSRGYTPTISEQAVTSQEDSILTEGAMGLSPSFSAIAQSTVSQEDQSIDEILNKIFSSLHESTGLEISKSLQSIADIILLSQGAMAIKDMRQWISKLRSFRGPLEDAIKFEFKDVLEKWKEKFGKSD